MSVALDERIFEALESEGVITTPHRRVLYQTETGHITDKVLTVAYKHCVLNEEKAGDDPLRFLWQALGAMWLAALWKRRPPKACQIVLPGVLQYSKLLYIAYWREKYS